MYFHKNCRMYTHFRLSHWITTRMIKKTSTRRLVGPRVYIMQLANCFLTVWRWQSSLSTPTQLCSMAFLAVYMCTKGVYSRASVQLLFSEPDLCLQVQEFKLHDFFMTQKESDPNGICSFLCKNQGVNPWNRFYVNCAYLCHDHQSLEFPFHF